MQTKTKEPVKSAPKIKLGQTVIYRATEDDTFPVIVTRLNEDGSFNGQAFMDGTQVKHVENAVIGDDVGQCAV